MYTFEGNEHDINSIVWAVKTYFNMCKKTEENPPKKIEGVYVIWSTGEQESTIIYVGSGDILDRVQKHQTQTNDPVKIFIDENPTVMLNATFAEIRKEQNEEEDLHEAKYKGAENYLGYIYRPSLRQGLDLDEEERYPNKTPREVNLLSNEYFKTSPVSEESTPYDINLDNWDEYRKAFCKWAEEQHGEDFAEPQKEDNH